MQQPQISEAAAGARGRWAYWPEIDGLRAIAVLAVILFHLRTGMLPGGFVGVDIFFAISGFLITSILLDDIARGAFSIARFYQRRISRIFPVLILVICATLMAGALLYSSQDMASLGINSAAAALSLINMKLIAQGSYFVMSPDAQPLMHYWSLAVEEQFYVLFPLYLFLVMRFTRWPMAITLALAVMSFAVCVALTPGYQPLAFYSLPTRAWELLIGATLALYRAKGRMLNPRAATLAVWAGVVMIAGSVVLIREANGFPGWVAAFPVLGTALLIAPTGGSDATPSRLLRQPWMVAIGKRSYSLYLWHWPVFSFVDYALFTTGELTRTLIKIGLTVALAMLSYSVVERPMRHYLNTAPRRLPLFLTTGAVVLALALGGVWLRSALYFDVLPSTIASGGTVVRGGDKATIILSGDSQAAMYGTEIASIARERGFTLHALGTAGRNQLPGEEGTSWPAVARLIAEKKPDLVILIDAWSEKLAGDPAALRQALIDIEGNAKQVLLVTQAPMAPANASRDGFRNGARPPFPVSAEARDARRMASAMIHSFANEKITVLDVAPMLTERNGGLRVVGPAGRLTYFDQTHLSDEGTRMLRPALAAGIDAAIARAR